MTGCPYCGREHAAAFRVGGMLPVAVCPDAPRDEMAVVGRETLFVRLPAEVPGEGEDEHGGGGGAEDGDHDDGCR